MAVRSRRQTVALGSRRAAVVVCLGNAVEWYDFALYTGLATVLSAVLTPGGWDGFLTVFGVFAVSCLFRPLGSLIVGMRADRLGRRPALAATILLMSTATAAIGLLPPWASIGVAAPLCLLGLRAVQAFCAGGEIGVSVAYLAELSPPESRGRYGQWYIATVAAGFAAGVGMSALLAVVLDPEAFLAWGWRIAFLLALPLGAVGISLRRRQLESPSFRPRENRIAPLQVLSEHKQMVRRSAVIAGAYSATFSVWFLFLPSYLTSIGATSLVLALLSALTGLVAAAVAAPQFGRISDAVGRRPVLIAAAAALAVAAVPMYLWMVGGSVLATATGSVVIGVVLGAFVLPAFLAEQLPTRVRATGLGLAYGIGSAVVGGTAPLVATLLARSATTWAVPAYLMVWAIGALIAIVRSPETAPAVRGPARLRTRSVGQDHTGVSGRSKVQR